MTEPMLPLPYRISRRVTEGPGIFTFELEPAGKADTPTFAPGQFNMLYAFGLGEVPISISGDPKDSRRIIHTVRAVGAVTRGLERLKRMEFVGLRGPFGSRWPATSECAGLDVLVIAGGLGIAPLRPAIYALMAARKTLGTLHLLYGVRTPKDLLFGKEIARWKSSKKIGIHLASGQAPRGWRGPVGPVTALLPAVDFRPKESIAMICGPEIMMRFTAMELEKRGVPKERIFVSLERNMKCAVGFCGHCQFGPHFICMDGPIFSYDRVESLMRVREL